MSHRRTAVMCGALLLVLAACGGGGGPPAVIPPAPAPIPSFVGDSPTGLASLSGIVMQSTGNSLPGVLVTVVGRTGTTDANGQFIISEVVGGLHDVFLDATGATGDAGTRYGTLHLNVVVKGGGAESLDQVVVLPDLNNPATATQNVGAMGGATGGPIAAQTGNVALTGPTGTVITIGGVPLTGNVDVAATPVPLIDLPMPIPPQAQGAAANFVTIQPPNATFTPPLNLQIPNTNGLAPGTNNIAIWSFDHDVGDWVNRSLETGNFGTVDATGAFIQAPGVITKGGWHGGGLPLPTTTAIGRVIDQAGTPRADIYVFTNSGQSGRTATDGTFSITGVTADPVDLRVTAPVTLGGVTTTASLAAVVGGNTDFGDITLTIPTTGQVSGVVRNLGTGVGSQTVTLTGAGTGTTTTCVHGDFWFTGLAPGNYTASTTFAGDSTPTQVNFTINAGQTTIVLIEKASATGVVTAKVTLVTDGQFHLTPMVANATTHVATVTLARTGLPSLVATTDASGMVTFNSITGAFSLTAQMDVAIGAGITRIATTQLFEDPPGGQAGLILIPDGGGGGGGPPTLNTNIDGMIVNIPALAAGENLEVTIQNEEQQFNALVLAGPMAAPPNAPFSINVAPGTYRVWSQIVSEGAGADIQRTFPAAAALPNTVTVADGATEVAPNIDYLNTAQAIGFASKTIVVNNLADLTGENEIASGLVKTGGEAVNQFTTWEADGSGLAPPATSSVIVGPPAGHTSIFKFESEFLIGGQDASQEATVNTAPGSTLTFDLLGPPTITAPADAATLTVAQAHTMTISWTLGTGTPNFSVATIGSRGATGIVGVDKVEWLVLIPKSVTTVTLSTPNLPMFAPGNTYDVEAMKLHFANSFDPDLVQNLSMFDNVKGLLSGDFEASDRSISISTSP